MEDNIMTISRETLVNEALSLPPVERVTVIDRLLASLDEPDQKLDALWAEEAEARLEAFERGDIRSVTLEEMLAKYRQTGC
jgi:putative addiction module component (TIGR02574 family)